MTSAVIYYTRFGHNEVIARAVAGELGAEMRRIETPKEHGYPWMGFTAFFNIRVGIKPMDFDLSGFDCVVLCTPIWAFRPAPPARTFLRKARLPAKLAVCFSTGGGSSVKAQEFISRDLAGRGVTITAFGEINTDKVSEDALLQAAREFADRLRAG